MPSASNSPCCSRCGACRKITRQGSVSALSGCSRNRVYLTITLLGFTTVNISTARDTLTQAAVRATQQLGSCVKLGGLGETKHRIPSRVRCALFCVVELTNLRSKSVY